MSKLNFLRDPLFIVAVLAGPVFVLILLSVGAESTFRITWDQKLVLWYIQVALLYPVLEEIVFRGMIQGYLWKTRFGYNFPGNISMPNIITSILFTALHFIFHAPVWAMMVFIPSIIFGFFRDRFSLLIPAILLHIIYNASYYFTFNT